MKKRVVEFTIAFSGQGKKVSGHEMLLNAPVIIPGHPVDDEVIYVSQSQMYEKLLEKLNPKGGYNKFDREMLQKVMIGLVNKLMARSDLEFSQFVPGLFQEDESGWQVTHSVLFLEEYDEKEDEWMND